MNYFIYTSHHFTPQGKYELNKLTSLPMCGFIAKLVEHRTGIAEVTVSNPVEAMIFSRLLLSNCLNWKINCNDHSSLLYSERVTLQFKYVGCLAGGTYFLYGVLMSPNKDEIAVHCCDPALLQC